MSRAYWITASTKSATQRKYRPRTDTIDSQCQVRSSTSLRTRRAAPTAISRPVRHLRTPMAAWKCVDETRIASRHSRKWNDSPAPAEPIASERFSCVPRRQASREASRWLSNRPWSTRPIADWTKSFKIKLQFFGAEVVQASLIASVMEQFFPILMKALPSALAPYKLSDKLNSSCLKGHFNLFVSTVFRLVGVAVYIFNKME